MADPPAKEIHAPISKYCTDCFLLKSTEIVISQLGNITQKIKSKGFVSNLVEKSRQYENKL